MTLERPDDVLGRQGLAIVELDALADMEIPFRAIVRAVDASRKAVLVRALGPAPHNRIADLAGQVNRHLAGRERGVERLRSGATAKATPKRTALFRPLGANSVAQHGARRRGRDAA